MKPKLGQLTADFGGGDVGELNPHPCTDYFGNVKQAWTVRAEHGKQAVGV
jgi:hypothetical protein